MFEDDNHEYHDEHKGGVFTENAHMCSRGGGSVASWKLNFDDDGSQQGVNGFNRRS